MLSFRHNCCPSLAAVVPLVTILSLVLAGCETKPTPKPIRLRSAPPLAQSEYITTTTPSAPVPPQAAAPIPRVAYDPVLVPQMPAIQPFEQWSEQQAAADALGRIGPPAVPQLIQALRNRDPLVRKEAAQVLARMGSDAREAVPDLMRLLDDEDETIRKTAARTLGRIGPDAAPAVPALMRTLLQPNPLPPDDNIRR